MKPRPPHGFTILETLVVIGIIALLMAILMPAIANSRRQAQRVACQAQLHQLVIAWHHYLDENAGRFPHGPTLSVDYGGKQGVIYNEYLVSKPLNKYVGLPPMTPTAEIFHCPSDRDPAMQEIGTARQSFQTCYDFYGTSYKANRFLVGTGTETTPLDPCSPVIREMNQLITSVVRSQIGDESRLIMLGDFGWEDTWSIASSSRAEWHGRPEWHNIGFMDGHADFTPVYKGIYVDARYTVLPFRDLQQKAAILQRKHSPQQEPPSRPQRR